jgi:hypothetical protein
LGFPNQKGIQGAVSASEAIIHCNHKIDAPFLITVEFDRDFIPGSPSLPQAGSYQATEGEKQGRVYLATVVSPPLLSNEVVVVTVYGSTAEYPRVVKVNIKPLK